MMVCSSKNYILKSKIITISSPRGNTWGYEETVSLLEAWAEDTIQRQQKIESIRDRIR
jgi:mannitol/fructose-specific phosphotransferase system IIA component